MAERAAEAGSAVLAGGAPLVDVHAHFLHAGCGRRDWEARNRSRLDAGVRIGITVHVASILGSWGHTSPTYFPSPADLTVGNDAMFALQARHADCVRSYVTVNPNEQAHAADEIARGMAQGAVGIKLAASRRADDPLVDRVAELAARHGVPVLHHIWQHRTREWPNQEISDGLDLGRLAARHPTVSFILAHIGGGGDYMHTFRAVDDIPNIFLDFSGSGVDRGMLDGAVMAVGVQRCLWGCDLTMETGLAKLRALEIIGLTRDEISDLRWRNAARIYPVDSLPGGGSGAPTLRRTAEVGAS